MDKPDAVYTLMRDEVIMQAFKRFEKAVSHDVANLTKQNVLNRSRIYALERVVFGSRGAFFKAVALNLLAPERLKNLINTAHAFEVSEFNAAMEKRQELNGNGDKIKII